MQTMKRMLCVAVILTAAAVPSMAEDAQAAFGGGGPALGLFLPDLTEIDAFVESAGYPALDGNLVLIGGNGRGGVMPGVSVGGGGWGAWIEATEENLTAEYGLGLGGFDLGFAVGGTERSVLTVGVLVGGGAAGLTLTEEAVPVPLGIAPRGIVIDPTVWNASNVFAFAAPYVDAQIQLLSWMGIGLRAGYLWAPLGWTWGDDDKFDPPDLTPSGPFVQFSIRFGGLVWFEP